MSNNQKDVELRIRARDYSQKTLKDLAKTTENLTQLQKQQAKAAELGAGKMKDLEAVYGRLEDAGRATRRHARVGVPIWRRMLRRARA